MKPIELAVCVIIDDYDRILLLHRSTDDYSQWELPGGKIEGEEPAERAAVRELHEELGIQVQLRRVIGSGEFDDNDKIYRVTWFQADIAMGEPSVREPDTFDDLDYFEIDDLMSLSMSASLTLLLNKITAGEIAIRG